MKKVAVVLSGNGFLDGAEVTESVSLLISLSRLGTDYEVFAPNKDFKAISHSSSEILESSKRNILEESSRITRGKIQDLAKLNPENFDGVAFPGGYGVAKNLCSWAQDGAKCSVDTKTRELVENFHKNSKPILALCIAPALIARILGQTASGLSLTIGNDQSTAEEIEKTGADHVECEVEDFVTDRAHKVISTPAYMYDAKPHQVFVGIEKACAEFIEMC